LELATTLGPNGFSLFNAESVRWIADQFANAFSVDFFLPLSTQGCVIPDGLELVNATAFPMTETSKRLFGSEIETRTAPGLWNRSFGR
jgi:hypothetical protein